jgi:hypothetical protein
VVRRKTRFGEGLLHNSRSALMMCLVTRNMSFEFAYNFNGTYKYKTPREKTLRGQEEMLHASEEGDR